MGSVRSLRDLPALDGLRGLAALFVVAWHMPETLLPLRPASSYLAVDLFFCLSGFVIARAFGDRLRAGLDPRRFLMMRLMRLYPVYLAALVLGLVALGVRADPAAEAGLAGLAAVLLFALAVLPAPPEALPGIVFLFPLCPPAWSLMLEVAVNGLYGAAARTLSLMRLAASALAFAGLLAGVALLFRTLDLGYGWHNVGGGLVRVLFSFTAGVLLHRLRLRSPLRPRHGYAAAALLVAVTLALPVPEAVRALYDLAAVMVVFPLAIVLAADARSPPAAEAASGVAGELSYPVYLFHVPVIDMAGADGRFGALVPDGPAGAAAVLAAVLALAAAAVALVDRPVRDGLRGLFARDGLLPGAGGRRTAEP